MFGLRVTTKIFINMLDHKHVFLKLGVNHYIVELCY